MMVSVAQLGELTYAAKWCTFSIHILVTPKIWLPAPTQNNSSVPVPLLILDIVNKVWNVYV